MHNRQGLPKILILLSLVVFLSGCNQKTSSPKPSIVASSVSPSASPSQTVSTNEVTITSHGFEPAVITIKKGTKVTWTNLDENPHRPAVDPYPLHNGLNSFDSKTPINKNETYQFTFDKVGDFAYADHLRPITFTGRVIVTQ